MEENNDDNIVVVVKSNGTKKKKKQGQGRQVTFNAQSAGWPEQFRYSSVVKNVSNVTLSAPNTAC